MSRMSHRCINSDEHGKQALRPVVIRVYRPQWDGDDLAETKETVGPFPDADVAAEALAVAGWVGTGVEGDRRWASSRHPALQAELLYLAEGMPPG